LKKSFIVVILNKKLQPYNNLILLTLFILMI